MSKQRSGQHLKKISKAIYNPFFITHDKRYFKIPYTFVHNDAEIKLFSDLQGIQNLAGHKEKETT